MFEYSLFFFCFFFFCYFFCVFLILRDFMKRFAFNLICLPSSTESSHPTHRYHITKPLTSTPNPTQTRYHPTYSYPLLNRWYPLIPLHHRHSASPRIVVRICTMPANSINLQPPKKLPNPLTYSPQKNPTR